MNYEHLSKEELIEVIHDLRNYIQDCEYRIDSLTDELSYVESRYEEDIVQ
jgi:hypothetical protein